jgi:hypothetical protein
MHRYMIVPGVGAHFMKHIGLVVIAAALVTGCVADESAKEAAKYGIIR